MPDPGDTTPPEPASTTSFDTPGDAQYELLINHSPETVVVHEGQVLVFVNPAGLRLIGASNFGQVIGRPITDFVSPESVDPLFVRIRSLDRFGATSEPSEMRLRRIDGTLVDVEARSVFTTWGGQPAYLAVLRDLTAQKRIETAAAHDRDQLEYRATHDSLTDLPNRLRIVEALRATLNDQTRAHSVAVLFIDLDKLKTVNDSLGHSTGDDILRIAAERLYAVVPSDGIIGRVGGDEFVAVIPGEDGYIDTVCDTIHAALARPIKLEGWALGITASVGVVLVPAGDPRTVDDLLRDADYAMYAAKESGGEHTVRFSPRLRNTSGSEQHRPNQLGGAGDSDQA